MTEAGTKWSGSLKSAVGLGTLLADGIGDTIRISLSTFHAEEEVKVAWEILKALKLRERGPVLIACPTCGRLQFDMDTVVAEVERRLEAYEDPIEVSVLGCAVNGIGEARHADFGITGAKDMGMIYSKGEPLKKVPTEQLVDELFKEIDRYYAAGKKVQRDERAAAEARAWLAENEDETAMTPERIAALEAAAAERTRRPAPCSSRCSSATAHRSKIGQHRPPRRLPTARLRRSCSTSPSRQSPGDASAAAERRRAGAQRAAANRSATLQRTQLATADPAARGRPAAASQGQSLMAIHPLRVVARRLHEPGRCVCCGTPRPLWRVNVEAIADGRATTIVLCEPCLRRDEAVWRLHWEAVPYER